LHFIGINIPDDPGDLGVGRAAHLDHVGTLEGEDEDSIYNGAYDNAMGVALMIEAARALAAMQPARSILFVALTGDDVGIATLNPHASTFVAGGQGQVGIYKFSMQSGAGLIRYVDDLEVLVSDDIGVVTLSENLLMAIYQVKLPGQGWCGWVGDVVDVQQTTEGTG